MMSDGVGNLVWPQPEDELVSEQFLDTIKNIYSEDQPLGEIVLGSFPFYIAGRSSPLDIVPFLTINH